MTEIECFRCACADVVDAAEPEAANRSALVGWNEFPVNAAYEETICQIQSCTVFSLVFKDIQEAGTVLQNELAVTCSAWDVAPTCL